MNCARNCENLLNSVKVIPKTLLVPFFSGHGVEEMHYCVTVFPEKSNFSDENVAEEMEDKLENDKRGIFHYGSGQLKK